MTLKGRLVGHFLKGLVIVGPVAFTLYICYRLARWINDAMSVYLTQHHLGIPTWLGLIILVLATSALLTLIGYLSGNLIMRGVLDAVDRQFARFPLIKLVHSSLKDLISAFAGNNRAFDQPVLVSPMGDGGIRLPGFVTRKSMETWGLPGHVAVYLPAAYNFAGQLIVVPKDRVTPVTIASSDMMTFVISGGISGGEPKTK